MGGTIGMLTNSEDAEEKGKSSSASVGLEGSQVPAQENLVAVEAPARSMPRTPSGSLPGPRQMQGQFGRQTSRETYPVERKPGKKSSCRRNEKEGRSRRASGGRASGGTRLGGL